VKKIDRAHNINTQTNMRLRAVYADKMFQKAAATFKSYLIKHLTDSGRLKIPDDFTHFSKVVLYRDCGEEAIERYEKLICDYQIKDSELWTYLGLSQAPDKDHAISIVFDSNKYLTINIYPWAKKQDLIDSWHRIEELLKTRDGYVGKLRGPKDIELIYAVSKARKRGESFAQIADALNENRLEGYDKKHDNSKEWDQWTLLDHFNRYKNIVAI